MSDQSPQSPSSPLTRAFSSTILSIAPSRSTSAASATSSSGGGSPDDLPPPTSSCIVPSSTGEPNSYQTTAFYADTSGRARVRLTLRLDCGTAEDVDTIAESGCLVPAPAVETEGGDGADGAEGDDKGEDGDDSEKGGGETKGEDAKSDKGKKKQPSKPKDTKTASPPASLRFECSPALSSHNAGQQSSLAVEAVTILSTHLDKSDPDDPAVLFRAEVSVRASEVDAMEGDGRGRGTINDGGEGEGEGEGDAVPPPAVLEIRAILSERVVSAGRSTGRAKNKKTRSGGDQSASASSSLSSVPLGLLALELGSGIAPPPVPSAAPASSSPTNSSSSSPPPRRQNQQQPRLHYATRLYPTPPATLRLTLVDPLSVTVREVGGARAAMGATLVSVTVSHSDEHNEQVVVTNLALHPGHSRLWGVAGQGQQQQQQPTPQQGRRGQQYQNQYQQQQQQQLSRTFSSDALPYHDPTNPAGPSGSRRTNHSIRAGPHSVIDMSRQVRWGYAPGTAPTLPLILKPREAFATVLQIDAGEHLRGRTFVSPVVVTALVGGTLDDEDEDGGSTSDGTGAVAAAAAAAAAADPNDNATDPPPSPVVVAADARWTTARLAVEPADAFRVDMSLMGDSRCRVGAPVVVGLRVMNLSNETRDLMLLMAKDEESNRDKDGGLRLAGGSPRGGAGRLRVAGRGNGYRSASSSVVMGSGGGGASPHRAGSSSSVHQGQQQQQQHHGVNTAVVSEVNGYTFGVWGLSGDDDGTTRHNRDHELLAVDAALLLGEVKGQHTIEAELRFVPLREGTLDVPNLKLYDKLGGRWYNCVHLLKIVAAAK